METIYRFIGKRGRITIPYSLRVQMGFKPNDLVSFTRDGDTIIVKHEMVCDHCTVVGGPETKEITPRQDNSKLTDEESERLLARLIFSALNRR